MLGTRYVYVTKRRPCLTELMPNLSSCSRMRLRPRLAPLTVTYKAPPFFSPDSPLLPLLEACSSPMNRVAICHHFFPRRHLRVIRPSSPSALVPSCNSSTARPRGIAKASPVIAPHLLNIEPFRHSPRQFATMASATGFYDFKPLDSTHAMPRKPRAVDPRQHQSYMD